MTAVVSTVGATQIAHDGETYTADETGVFDVPESLVASHGQLLDLIPAAEHFAQAESERFAEALKPEHLHARIVALEEAAAGAPLTDVEVHIASLVDGAEKRIAAAVKKAVDEQIAAATKKAAAKPAAKA